MYVICPFPCVAFSFFYFVFNFVTLITVCLCVFLLRFILPGTLSASWTWLTISFLRLGKFSALISLNTFSGPFSLLLGLCNANVCASSVVPEVS